MLGKNLFKVEVNADLSGDRLKSLILFYNPLIGKNAHYLYEFLYIKGTSGSFEELNKLLNSLNISIDEFEKSIEKLNEYKLVTTLKKNDEDRYIFVLKAPLTCKEFINDDLFVRDFILKTSGLYYQSLISDIRYSGEYKDYDDISSKYNPKELENWTKDDESFLKPVNKDTYIFDSFFDVNAFLADVSNNLFPLKYRTYENLKEIATLADLYNISAEKMRSYLPRVAASGTNTFDLNMLRYLCQNSITEYKYIEGDNYNIPCQLFLMNKQEGKEVSPYDKKIIYNLANKYNLKPCVINVLIEHTLRNCNNRLLENYLYPIASDLHRNNVETAKAALDNLERFTGRKVNNEVSEKYDTSNNPEFDEERRKALRNRRGKDE